MFSWLAGTQTALHANMVSYHALPIVSSQHMMIHTMTQWFLMSSCFYVDITSGKHVFVCLLMNLLIMIGLYGHVHGSWWDQAWADLVMGDRGKKFQLSTTDMGHMWMNTESGE